MKKLFPFTLAPEPEEDARQKGAALFAPEALFLKGVVALDGLPASDRVEICFAGRSNVGKSSLINAICGQKRLARASNTPGRTQEINFFTLKDSHYLVDLPGYGFAEAPLDKVKAWQKLLKAYLAGRQNLRRAFVLIDARHGIKAVDEDILSLLDTAAVTFQIVLTKADKLKSHQHAPLLTQIEAKLQKHPAAFPQILMTSAEKRIGVENLRAVIAALL